MTSYNRDEKVGPWAEEKLQCLGGYLSAYTTIMRRQTWCQGYFYIDAFAGKGRSEIRGPDTEGNSFDDLLTDVGEFQSEDEDLTSYVNGSPFVALDIKHPFSRYYFIEKRPDRAEQLRSIAQEYAGRRDVKVINDDAFVAIERILNDPVINWKACRAVIFLDPFGMQVPWSTIDTIAKKGGIEVIVNLPVGMAIQRLLPRSGQFSSHRRDQLTEYFGSPDWEKVIYQTTTDMFGDTTVSKSADSGELLVDWYRERLKKAFGFSPRPRLIRNSFGSHLYYLLFAGPNAQGAKIADHVLRQGNTFTSRRS